MSSLSIVIENAVLSNDFELCVDEKGKGKNHVGIRKF